MTRSSIDIHALDWRSQPFDRLGAGELYAVLALRAAVFVVEQQCVYQDVDGKDPQAHHLAAWHGDHLAAYARLLPPGVSFPEVSIGRVVTAPEYRGTGLGRLLVARSVALCAQLYGAQPIRIGAQSRLKAFYAGFGFVPSSADYIEDGIPHLLMLRPQALAS
jgi:ElaA protein